MILFQLIALLLLAHCVSGARKLRGNRGKARGAKSLVNTFPFNANEVAEEHHDHHAAQEPAQAFDARNARQDEEVPVDFGAVAAAEPGDDGKKCIDKVEMVEQTEYDDVVQCGKRPREIPRNICTCPSLDGRSNILI